MKKLLVVFALLWVAFAGVGVAIHVACREAPRNEHNWVDISAYDAEGYVGHFVNIQTLFMLKVRHPALKPICLPYYVVGSMVTEKMGREAGKIAVICTVGAVGAATWLLLWLTLVELGVGLRARIASSLLWLSFGHVWILGALPESYPIAQLLLVATCYILARGVRDGRAYLALALVSCGVTITNVVKPLAAWGLGVLSIDQLRARFGGRLFWPVVKFAALGAVLLALLFFGYGLFRWYVVVGCGFVAGIKGVWAETFGYVASGMPLAERLWYTWQSFFCEPICLHGSVIATPILQTGYATWLPHVVVAMILGLSAWSAIRNWRRPLVRAIIGMISFDFALHLGIGWGIDEGQLYCGHWFWALPILIALLPRKVVWVGMCAGVAVALHNVCILCN